MHADRDDFFGLDYVEACAEQLLHPERVLEELDFELVVIILLNTDLA